ncbi:hypothetical protein BC827DRAFT_547458 [Russula dissimulans]|nr:hypothetical protein BC827DRAFT_547458 [Russula dissimulans]
MFEIIARFVFLPVVFPTLNARLGTPPFALSLVALSPTDRDGFFDVTDAGRWDQYVKRNLQCSGLITPPHCACGSARGFRSAIRYHRFLSLPCSCFPLE